MEEKNGEEEKMLAICPKIISKRSPTSSKSKHDKHRLMWDVKKKLVEQRLMDLTQKRKNFLQQEESGHVDRPIKRHKAKVKTSNAPCSSASASILSSTSAMDRAQKVEDSLLLQFPCFSKLLLKSHVSGGFWLGLPNRFCCENLPKRDDTVILVDEDGKKYETKYLVSKNGLSGGWRGFSIAHQLLAGDVLVFQLIEPCKFKIYIVRESRLTEVDGAIDLLNLDCHENEIDPVTIDDRPKYKSQGREETMLRDLEPLALDMYQENVFSGDHSDSIGSEIAEGIRFSERNLDFKDVKCFDDFNINVNGLILDSDVPTHLRRKYYDLCHSQEKYLHDNLIEGLNSKLAAGMISEIINISDAIKAANLTTTPLHCLESWEKTLKAFEDLGMVVGFLRARIHKLVTLLHESQSVIESKIKKRDDAKVEMVNLEAKLLSIKALVNRIDEEIDGANVKNDELRSAFKEVAGSPWCKEYASST